jgi:hypothetical protein
MWGGIAIPKDKDNDEASFFAGGGATANPPMIAFHGRKDQVFPFNDDIGQDINFSIPPIPGEQDYNSSNACTNLSRTFTLDDNQGSIDLKMGSSLNMYDVLQTLNRFTELYVDCTMKHGLDADGPNFKSDFGIGLPSNQIEVTQYMVQRTAIFFQGIMNGAHQFGVVGRSMFRECENNRVQCNIQENNACTSNNDLLCP